MSAPNSKYVIYTTAEGLEHPVWIRMRRAFDGRAAAEQHAKENLIIPGWVYVVVPASLEYQIQKDA